MKLANNQAINGKFLYYAFVAGSQQLLFYQEELNRINVFPVRDKDTGTNLASTTRAVIDTIKPDLSYKKTMGNIAEAALIGARGNSGVIFAQFLHGLDSETKNIQQISFLEFAESVRKSIPFMYEAVTDPMEGTILTVIRDWSDFLSSQKERIPDFKKVMIDSNAVLEKSLTETTTKLKGLQKYGFVDAGAKGFVVFIKGVIDFIKNRNIRPFSIKKNEPISFPDDHAVHDKPLNYRYCTEALLENVKGNLEYLKQLITKDGDSVVIAGSERLCRIHVHTNEPAALFSKLSACGRITFQKVDDMLRQREMASKRKWNVALVTDSACDLSQELIDLYQIHVVPMNLNFGDNHYLDKLTIQPDQFYDLLESSTAFPKTSQINERTFTHLYAQLASHYDAIISLHLSSKLSGTYGNSVKAGQRIQKEFNKPVHVIDSKTLSGALGLLVLKTAQNIEAGMGVEAIVKSLETDILKAKIFVSVKDLKYMIKGGRVSKPAGFLAETLGINPVVSMAEDGHSLLFGKTFSQKASLNKIFNHISTISRGQEVWNYIILHAHNPDGALKAELEMVEITGKKPVSTVDISPVIGMHAGNGALAVALLITSKT